MSKNRRLFLRALCGLLMLAGITSFAVAIAIPASIPIAVPLGCVLCSGSVAMFQGSLAVPRNTEAPVEESHHAEAESVHSHADAPIIQNNLFFIYANRLPIVENAAASIPRNKLLLS